MTDQQERSLRARIAELEAVDAAARSLRGELTTIFGIVKPHHGMTWEASMLARIGEVLGELEAERDAAKQWATELQGRQRHHIARIEHLEAALREALSHIPQANTLKPHYERENVVREILERALTTSTQEDARR